MESLPRKVGAVIAAEDGTILNPMELEWDVSSSHAWEAGNIVYIGYSDAVSSHHTLY